MYFPKNYDLRHYRTTRHWWQMPVSQSAINWFLLIANIFLILSDYIGD
jgi:hypothetical protein